METLILLAAVYIGFLLVFSSLSYHAIRNDKKLSVQGLPRIAEWKLHSLELLGGVIGSYFAQRILRHKVDKMTYQIKFYIIVGFHVGCVLTGLYFRDFINYLHLPCVMGETSVA